MRLVLIEWADLARGGSAHRLDLDDVSAHVGEHLAAEEAALGGEIEDAIWRQHRHWTLGRIVCLPCYGRGFSASAGICDGSAYPHPTNDMNIVGRPLPACGSRHSRQPRERQILDGDGILSARFDVGR